MSRISRLGEAMVLRELETAQMQLMGVSLALAAQMEFFGEIPTELKEKITAYLNSMADNKPAPENGVVMQGVRDVVQAYKAVRAS